MKIQQDEVFFLDTLNGFFLLYIIKSIVDEVLFSADS